MLLSDCLLFSWVYFPASGYRDLVAGAFEGVGLSGYVWSTSVWGVGFSTINFLGFTVEYLQPFRRDFRPYGLPVRCVQELTLACYILEKSIVL